MLSETIKIMLPGHGNLIRKPKGWVGTIEDDQYNKISCFCELVDIPTKIVTKPMVAPAKKKGIPIVGKEPTKKKVK